MPEKGRSGESSHQPIPFLEKSAHAPSPSFCAARQLTNHGSPLLLTGEFLTLSQISKTSGRFYHRNSGGKEEGKEKDILRVLVDMPWA